MANEVEELVVAARPEGIDETVDGLEDMEGQFDETADSMGETADEFAGLQQKWQGAMGALVSGLAVAAAGLLSQVPVIGEAMAGLGAIVEGVAFQMDKVLRPALQPITDLFFQVSEMVFEAEGALGALIGVGATVVSVLGLLVGVIAAVGAVLPSLTAAGALGTAIAGLKTLIVTIGGVVASFVSLPVVAAAAIAAVGALIIGLVFNIGGLRDKAIAIFNGLWETAVDIFGGLVGDVVAFFGGLKDDVVETIDDLIGRAKGWGETLYDNFVGQLKGLARAIAMPFLDGLNTVIDTINSAIERLPSDVRSRIGISTMDNVSASDIGLDVQGGGGGGFGADRGGGIRMTLDGRDITEQTGRYDRDTTARRGTDG